MQKTKTKHAEINEAEKTIAEMRELETQMRSYEHDAWHAVNVKRYSDGLDRDDLLEIAREVSPADEVLAHVLAEKIGADLDGSNGLYDNWLSEQWDQLNYEISDIVALGMREKPFDKIDAREGSRWAKNKFVLSLGRSGGWACFKTVNAGLVDEIEDFIVNAETPEDKDWIKELEEMTAALKDTIAQIHDLKAFIKKFNDGLDFKEEVKYRVEEIADQYDEKAEVKCYDTGGATIDRYTIIIGNSEAYGMSEDALSPAGFNQYIGDPSKLDRGALGKVIAFEKLPDQVQKAIRTRQVSK